MTWIIAYLGTALVFLAADAIWLGIAAKGFYATHLGGLLREQPDFAVAGVFYLAYAGGIVLFAVAPALESNSWRMALGYGAALGFLAYGTYDATNLATLKGWPPIVSIVDVVWGTAVTAASALAGLLITRALSGSG